MIINKKLAFVFSFLFLILLLPKAFALYASTTANTVEHYQIDSAYIDVSSDLTKEDSSNLALNQNPDPASPGGYVELRFKVQTFGQEVAEDVKFQIISSFPFSLDSTSSAVLELGDLTPGHRGEDAHIIFYKLRVDEDAVEGDNEIILKYYTKEIGWQTLKPFTVRVETNDTMLVIKEVLIDSAVEAGKPFDLILKIQNLADSTVKNVKASLELVRKLSTSSTVSYEDMPFSPYDSSNEQFIELLQGGETGEVVFKLIPDTDAESKPYKLSLTLSYSNAVGTSFEDTHIIGVSVKDDPKILMNLEDIDVYESNEKGRVTFSVSNIGTSQIKFVVVEMLSSDSYTVLSSDKVYLGNLESDDYETAEYNLFLTGQGGNLFKLKISYTDNYNNELEQFVDLPITIYTGTEAKTYGLTQQNNGRTAFLVMVLIALIGYAYKSYKKKKR